VRSPFGSILPPSYGAACHLPHARGQRRRQGLARGREANMEGALDAL